MSDALQQISVWILPVLSAVILHEVAHGYVAYRLGDPTAARMGRLTLNPLPHIDPIGTVILPLLLVFSGAPVFGWARPVPVRFGNLPNPKADMVKVAAAGPLTNLILASLSAAVLHVLAGWRVADQGFGDGLSGALLTPIWLMAANSVLINVVLAVFNMLPILPLDGGRVLAGLLPRAQAIAYSRLEPYGLIIVMALIFTDSLNWLVHPVVNFFLHALL
jgi:Zn-dependent protease